MLIAAELRETFLAVNVQEDQEITHGDIVIFLKDGKHVKIESTLEKEDGRIINYTELNCNLLTMLHNKH